MLGLPKSKPTHKGQLWRNDVFVLLTVDGGWGTWSAWGECSASRCGARGVMRRSRTCSSPAPLNGGQPCSGPAVAKLECIGPCVPGKSAQRPPLRNGSTALSDICFQQTLLPSTAAGPLGRRGLLAVRTANTNAGDRVPTHPRATAVVFALEGILVWRIALEDYVNSRQVLFVD